MGDFNSFVRADNKSAGHLVTPSQMRDFNACIFYCGLIGLDFHGPKFTWESKGTNEHLDWVLCDLVWSNLFLNAFVSHLAQTKLDHKPLFVNLNGTNIFSISHKLHFQSSWFLDDRFRSFVANNWKDDHSFANAISNFQPKLLAWNRNAFGNVFYRKQKLLNQISGIQKAMESNPSKHLSRLNDYLSDELNSFLLQEEAY